MLVVVADASPIRLEVLPVTASDDPAFQSLDEGERADALARLKRTNFHFREELLNDLLKKYWGPRQ